MHETPHVALVYEQMLLSRYALQGLAPKDREVSLDRSATVLLARLEASGPMTVAELADAFGLDVSTVHRQVAAAMRGGLIERLEAPEGGTARKHRPTPAGARRLRAEFEARAASFARVTADWSEAEVASFVALMRRFNEDLEQMRGQSWPRPTP